MSYEPVKPRAINNVTRKEVLSNEGTSGNR